MNNGSATASPDHAPTAAPPGSPEPAGQRWVKAWLALSAFLSLAGWSLSALGQLNRAGYAVFFTLAAISLGWYGGRRRGRGPRIGFRWRPRFRRPLPAAFAALAALMLAGSLYYPPSNYTGLNYHLGRVLQWLAEGRWWWVHTPVVRMDYQACNFEWMTTPLVLFTRSDRALFLVNFLPFLLLPGLIYSVFTRLGVRPRAAWPWMWLLPAGYNFLLQGGSIGNDAFGAVYALASIDFACRAWASRRVEDFWWSLVAVALLTGVKAISLPLALPWLVLALPLLPAWRRHWLATAPVALLAAAVSFIPTAVINRLHAGDWFGQSVELIQKGIHEPWFGVMGNAFQILLDNFIPPVFPMAGWWNVHAEEHFPRWFAAAIDRNFESGVFGVGEIPTEDYSGLGLGVCGLLTLTLLGGWWLGRTSRGWAYRGPLPAWLRRCALAAPWIALLVYSMKSGISTAARLIAPYYFPLLPCLLLGAGASLITRRGWWRALALGVMAVALLVLAISPDRPLWPARTILPAVVARHPQSHAATRALEVYSIYAERNDALAGVRALLPPDARDIGFIGDGDDNDIALWRPFGQRRVRHYLVNDPPGLLRSQVRYVVVGSCNLAFLHVPLADWLQTNRAEVLAKTNVMVKLGEGPQDWYITRLLPP